MSETVIAMFDERGTVVAWTHAAERLVGYRAPEAVDRSLALMLPCPGGAPSVSAFVRWCRARGGWSDTTALRHRDGRALDADLRIRMVRGQDSTVRWLVSAAGAGRRPARAETGSVREPFSAHAPVGIVVRDPRLRCTWVNDTMESRDDMGRDRLLGRRCADVLPAFTAGTLEAVIGRVLQSCATEVHEYRTWPATSPCWERTYVVSFSCLQGASGQALGVCAVSVDVTESRRTSERRAGLGETRTRRGGASDGRETGPARRYVREHTAALALQRDLLPHRLSGGTAVEVASRYLPADMESGVGGDWFDVIPLSGARVALVVGDVVGHGLHAAATMGRLRTAVHALADMELPPDELLAHLDDTVQRLAEEDTDAGERTPAAVGATCLYVVYDPVTRRCSMATAGHPPPAITDPQGRVTFPDLPAGAPLGLGLGIPFEAVELELPEGSLLALYTDGLIESRDQDIDVGMRRLGTALAQPGRSLEDLCTRTVDAFPGQVPSDDVTLLLVRTRSPGPGQVASWTLPGEQDAVRSARRLAARRLTEWGLEDLVDATQLIVSELVTNAVRHSTGPIGLRLIQHHVLTCEVFDTSVCGPRMRHARSADEGGRGLFLVAQLSRRWGCRSVAGGKVVWSEEDLGSASSSTRTCDRPHGRARRPRLDPLPT